MTSSTGGQPPPYYITPRVWRDEQPGDAPRLLVSIAFVPRGATERWQDVRLRSLEVRAGDERWTPRQSAVAPAADGAFEVTASGDATLPAAASATILVTLQTSGDEQRLELATTIQRVG